MALKRLVDSSKKEQRRRGDAFQRRETRPSRRRRTKGIGVVVVVSTSEIDEGDSDWLGHPIQKWGQTNPCTSPRQDMW